MKTLFDEIDGLKHEIATHAVDALAEVMRENGITVSDRAYDKLVEAVSSTVVIQLG